MPAESAVVHGNCELSLYVGKLQRASSAIDSWIQRLLIASAIRTANDDGV